MENKPEKSENGVFGTSQGSEKIQMGEFRRIGVLFAIMILFVIIAGIISRNFLTFNNIRSIMYQFIPLLLIGVSMFVVMSFGGIDFSIGSLVGLSGVIVGIFKGSFAGALLALVIGLLCGCINGLIAVKTPVKAFLVTIATATLIRGIAFTVSGGMSKPFRPNSNYFVYFVIQVLLAVVVVGASCFLLSGNYGIPDKEKTSVSSSKKDTISILSYLLSAFSAVIVGIFLSFRIISGQPAAGDGYEINAIIIAILGGALCGYAAIHIASTIIAALLFAIMVNFFVIAGVNLFVQNILKIVVLFIGLIPFVIKEANAQNGRIAGILSAIGGWIPLGRNRHSAE
ncbi:MAG: ABC transporter permease [Treponema sp.]|jgi:ribose transport system permease protein|nr:ABC transporter permease [Treponema sp.]